ncbi:MAG: methyltransferase domain-containing protein [Candidatus Bathyarchaeota archaeon]|nr:methyltransferase domain-containing protein [Candidatus Bathyarchaeota archaeon]
MLREAWTLAIETLSWIELQRLGERLALAKAARQLKIQDAKVVGLAHKLVFETLRRRNLLDFIINQALTPHTLRDFKLGPQAFLRLYTYETRFVKSGFTKAGSIARLGRSILGWHALKEVEETLGRILSTQFDTTFKKVGDEERIALLNYNPLWFVKYCFQLLGRSEALQFLESATQPLPTYLRINTLKASKENILENLKSQGIRTENVSQLTHAYKLLEAKTPLVKTRSFHEGLFYIQDKASCLAAEIANPASGITVLDVCAAPGAKTAYMAQLMQNKGEIYSIDYSKRRMHVWKRQMKRMGIKIAVPVIADVCHPLPLRLSADLVVLDPPCTSTGAFSKMPSAKWRLTKRSVLHMAQIQWKMLQKCAEHVKEGGYLIYSTCSVTLEENEMLIEKFLKWHPEFTLEETQPRIGLSGLRGQAKCQRLYPHLHNCNGFFIAKLLKTE